MSEFCMPSLGADMEDGVLVEWRVAPGAHVQRGDVVALVETQKGIVEIEIWETGVLGDVRVQPGTKVPVGTVLATVSPDGAAKPGAAPATRAAPPPPARSSVVVPAAPPVTVPPVSRERVLASPAARQLARERSVDLATLRGTGPHGTVTRADVDRAASAPPPGAPAAPAAPAADGMRRAIATAMSRSKREIPHYYLGAEIDMSRAVAFLDSENARRPVTERLVLAALELKAVALALRGFPDLNGTWTDGAHRAAEGIHVGVAVSLRQGGLVAPAIHDTDKRSLVELMGALSDVVARARRGALRSSELSDATITLTNLGDQGVDSVFGVIFPPQVAIVGLGTMRERPWAENGMLGVRPVVVASVSADHRVSDGHRGARFLAAVARLLQEPEKL